MNVTADPSNTGPLANRKLVLDALARLPAEQRTVIRRSYYDAWTVAQIADDLQVDEMTVTTRLHYGVRALLLSLEERGITRPRARAPWPRSSPPAQPGSDCQDGRLQDQR